MVKRELTIQYRLYPVAKIKENTWNPNQMSADKDGALREDMKLGGPTAIDPILTASKRTVLKDPFIPEDVRIIIDGNHRFRIARGLGWSKIRERFDPRITDGETARLISYAKNAERGEMDPYRQAAYFKWFTDRGWTHEKIANKHRIDRTTVTKHLSLIKINPQAREKLANVPRITISHLEPIATLNHGQQGKFVKEIVRDHKHDPPTVESIARGVRHIKEEARKTEALRQAVEKAKFKKCPMCGKPPVGFNYNWDGSSGRDQVRCDNWHHWSLSKGVEKEKHTTGGTSEPKIPQSIKTERTISEFAAAFRKALAGVLSRIDANGIDSINIDGRTKDGKKIRIDVSFWGWRVSMDLESTGQRIDLSVSDCKIKDHPEIKTRIRTGGYIDSKQKLAKLERQVQDLFQKFGTKKKG